MRNAQWRRTTQFIFILVGLVFTAFAVGFMARTPWTLKLVPLPSGTAYNNDTLGLMFIASMVVAWGVSSVYIGATGKLAPAVTSAINYILVFGGTGILYLQLYFQAANPSSLTPLLTTGFVSVLVALLSIFLLWALRNEGVGDPTQMPKALRIAIGVMTLFVGMTSVSLIVFKVNLLPWGGTTVFGVVYGWLFLGTGASLLYGLVRNKWEIVASQLLAFLAYDIVLIPPFIDFFSKVQADKLPGFIMYFGFVVGSGIIAVYYLFFDARTRITRFSAVPQQAVASVVTDINPQKEALS
jgi:hypothetical protein